MVPAPFADLLIALRFFSRLPLPVTARETALGSTGFQHAIAMTPVAGAIVGFCPALVLAGAIIAGLPPLIAAPLALAALIMVTGALHEDGLADCADGFGGGRMRERKLEIMRDSRIGTFGACAIGITLYLRAASLTVIAAHDLSRAVAVLLASAALSRSLCLLPLMLLRPARSDGAGASASQFSSGRFYAAIVMGLVIGAMPLFAGAPPLHVAIAEIIAVAAALGVCAIALRQIGGQTGDVAGAAQQAVEIVLLIAFAA